MLWHYYRLMVELWWKLEHCSWERLRLFAYNQRHYNERQIVRRTGYNIHGRLSPPEGIPPESNWRMKRS